MSHSLIRLLILNGEPLLATRTDCKNFKPKYAKYTLLTYVITTTSAYHLKIGDIKKLPPALLGITDNVLKYERHNLSSLPSFKCRISIILGLMGRVQTLDRK